MRVAKPVQSLKVTAGALSCFVVLSACGPTYGPELEGEWRLAEAHVSPVADLDLETAEQWVGYQAKFKGNYVSFNDYECRDAELVRDWTSAHRVFGPYEQESSDYGLRDDTPVQVINVLCKGQPWMTPGGQLVRVDQERLMMIWRGVFFEFHQTQ